MSKGGREDAPALRPRRQARKLSGRWTPPPDRQPPLAFRLARPCSRRLTLAPAAAQGRRPLPGHLARRAAGRPFLLAWWRWGYEERDLLVFVFGAAGLALFFVSGLW